jgi:aspartate aminotransferase
MYGKEELMALAKVVRDHDLLVIADDIYQKLIYDGAEFISILTVAPDLFDKVVIVNGVSKTYAMTGWRLGYALGPNWLISAMEKIQGQSTSNPTSFVQAAAIEALCGDQSCVVDMLSIFSKRRDLLVEGLNSIEGIACKKPIGAFYAFPNITALFGATTPAGKTINSSFDVADYFLASALVAVVPGGAFGSENNMRLSYATSDENIASGVKRIKAAVSELKGVGDGKNNG